MLDRLQIMSGHRAAIGADELAGSEAQPGRGSTPNPAGRLTTTSSGHEVTGHHDGRRRADAQDVEGRCWAL
jgi:hypothetical protein